MIRMIRVNLIEDYITERVTLHYGMGHPAHGLASGGGLAFTRTVNSSDLNYIEHDPEKWEPVFRKDHAPSKTYRAQSIQSEAIVL